MADVLVVRLPGAKEGPTISNPLLTSHLAARTRGQAEIDKNTSVSVISLTTVHRANVDVGQMVRVVDALQGEEWVGKIVAVDHYARGAEVICNLQVERPE